MKLRDIKKWTKDHTADIATYTLTVGVVLAYGNWSYKLGKQHQRLFFEAFNGCEWALHKQVDIRDLLKDENTKLWVGFFDGKMSYKIGD